MLFTFGWLGSTAILSLEIFWFMKAKDMHQCIQHIFHMLCKMNEESFNNVSINSEGSNEDISVSSFLFLRALISCR